MVSGFVFLWGSCVCEHVSLHLYVILCFFFAAFSCFLFVLSDLDLFVFLMPFLFYYYLDTCFLRRNRKVWMAIWREDLGVFGGGETVIIMFCIGEKSIFNKRKMEKEGSK